MAHAGRQEEGQPDDEAPTPATLLEDDGAGCLRWPSGRRTRRRTPAEPAPGRRRGPHRRAGPNVGADGVGAGAGGTVAVVVVVRRRSRCRRSRHGAFGWQRARRRRRGRRRTRRRRCRGPSDRQGGRPRTPPRRRPRQRCRHRRRWPPPRRRPTRRRVVLVRRPRRRPRRRRPLVAVRASASSPASSSSASSSSPRASSSASTSSAPPRRPPRLVGLALVGESFVVDVGPPLGVVVDGVVEGVRRALVEPGPVVGPVDEGGIGPGGLTLVPGRPAGGGDVVVARLGVDPAPAPRAPGASGRAPAGAGPAGWPQHEGPAAAPFGGVASSAGAAVVGGTVVPMAVGLTSPV